MSDLNEKMVLLGALTKYFNKTEDEITALVYEEDDDGNMTINEGAVDALISLDEERIKKLKGDMTTDKQKMFDDGYKKGQSESLSKQEKKIKEQYGIESDATGVELIAELIEKAGDGKETQITEENLKTNPIFIKLEKSINDEWKQKYEGLENDFSGFKDSIARKATMNGIKGKAKEVFLELNPALSETVAVAENQTRDFLDKLDEYEYDIVDEDIIIKKNGERIEDKHSNPISFEAFIKDEAAKRFDFKVQDDRDSAGNKNTGGGKKRNITKKEYNDLMANARTDEDILEIAQKYNVVD